MDRVLLGKTTNIKESNELGRTVQRWNATGSWTTSKHLVVVVFLILARGPVRKAGV